MKKIVLLALVLLCAVPSIFATSTLKEKEKDSNYEQTIPPIIVLPR